MPFAGPSPTLISCRCRSRADQSFITVKPPIAPSAPMIAAHLELVVELARALGIRAPRPPGRRSRPGSRSRRPACSYHSGGTSLPRSAPRRPHVLLERHRSRAPPAGAAPAAAGRRRRARTRRARAPTPPPVKNDCSVCAASWITRSPSIRPGQPRSSASSFGVNMQSFTDLARCGRSISRDRRAARGGSAPRSRSRARAPRRAARAGSRPSVRKTTSPSSVCEEAQLARRRARRSRDDPRRPPRRRARPRRRRRAAPPPPRPAARGASARRRPPARAALDRLLDLARDARAPPRATSSPGSFRCSETSVRPSTSQHADVVDLAHARHAIAAACAQLARDRVLVGRLDVDDDVRLRQRPLDRRLDRVRGGVPLPDRRARRDADHDVGELAAGRLSASAVAAARPAGSIAAIAAPRRLLRVGRRAVHQHVDVSPHQPQRRR